MPYEHELEKWRFLIALAHVDKKLMREERDFLYENIQQHAEEGLQPLLLQELKDGIFDAPEPKFDVFHLKDSRDKIDLLHMAHALFWADNDLDDREKFCLDKILEDIKSDTDTLALLKEELPSWSEHDEGEKCLKRYVEAQI